MSYQHYADQALDCARTYIKFQKLLDIYVTAKMNESKSSFAYPLVQHLQKINQPSSKAYYPICILLNELEWFDCKNYMKLDSAICHSISVEDSRNILKTFMDDLSEIEKENVTDPIPEKQLQKTFEKITNNYLLLTRDGICSKSPLATYISQYFHNSSQALVDSLPFDMYTCPHLTNLAITFNNFSYTDCRLISKRVWGVYYDNKIETITDDNNKRRAILDSDIASAIHWAVTAGKTNDKLLVALQKVSTIFN